MICARPVQGVGQKIPSGMCRDSISIFCRDFNTWMSTSVTCESDFFYRVLLARIGSIDSLLREAAIVEIRGLISFDISVMHAIDPSPPPEI